MTTTTATTRRTAQSIVNTIRADAEGRSFQSNDWGKRHADQWRRGNLYSSTDSRATKLSDVVPSLVNLLAKFADGYDAEYGGEDGRKLIDDAHSAPIFRNLALAAIDMLNIELHGLDAGTLDQTIRQIAMNEGFTDEIEFPA